MESGIDPGQNLSSTDEVRGVHHPYFGGHYVFLVALVELRRSADGDGTREM